MRYESVSYLHVFHREASELFHNICQQVPFWWSGLFLLCLSLTKYMYYLIIVTAGDVKLHTMEFVFTTCKIDKWKTHCQVT